MATQKPRPRKRGVLLPKSDDLSSTDQKLLTPFPRTGTYIQPSSSPRFDSDIERQHFMIFQTKTAPNLTGYFDTTVWNRKVLQICHDQAYARHAVVGLGALWKALDISQAPSNRYQHNVGGTQEAKALYAFALQQYEKALQLMTHIQTQEDPDRLRNTLISALLTTWFESIIGDQKDALLQAELGVDVLLGWKDECAQAPQNDWTSVKRLEYR
jgi:hypothetical protein